MQNATIKHAILSMQNLKYRKLVNNLGNVSKLLGKVLFKATRLYMEFSDKKSNYYLST